MSQRGGGALKARFIVPGRGGDRRGPFITRGGMGRAFSAGCIGGAGGLGLKPKAGMRHAFGVYGEVMRAFDFDLRALRRRPEAGKSTRKVLGLKPQAGMIHAFGVFGET